MPQPQEPIGAQSPPGGLHGRGAACEAPPAPKSELQPPSCTGCCSAPRSPAAPAVFDHVFDKGAVQEEVFQHTTLPLLETLLAGYSCSVFAHGALGVGKTHTMVGSKTSPSIVHLELYKRLKATKDKSCEVLVSYQQVYKEHIYDLLEPRAR